jgi:hypothetical protein
MADVSSVLQITDTGRRLYEFWTDASRKLDAGWHAKATAVQAVGSISLKKLSNLNAVGL